MGRERILSGRTRRAQRARNWDYRSIGIYFVTIVTKDRAPLFGALADGTVELNFLGEVVEQEWSRSSAVRRNVEVDAFVVMPNHLHGLVRITTELPRMPGPARPAMGNELDRPADSMSHSLSSIVRGFKAATTRQINVLRNTPGEAVWQASFHDAIIRDERHLAAVRQYIRDNPKNWPNDPLNSAGFAEGPDTIRP